MKVMHDRVAAKLMSDKDMVKVVVWVPGAKRGSRKTDVLEFRTSSRCWRRWAASRRRGVTNVVMEASGVYTEPADERPGRAGTSPR